MTWIIPKNLHTSACVQDMTVLDLGLQEQSLILEQSVMWRSKPSQSQTWLKRLKGVPWMQHLSGRMLKPSLELQKVFADEWTSYLPGIHVLPKTPSYLQKRDIDPSKIYELVIPFSAILESGAELMRSCEKTMPNLEDLSLWVHLTHSQQTNTLTMSVKNQIFGITQNDNTKEIFQQRGGKKQKTLQKITLVLKFSHLLEMTKNQLLITGLLADTLGMDGDKKHLPLHVGGSTSAALDMKQMNLKDASKTQATRATGVKNQQPQDSQLFTKNSTTNSSLMGSTLMEKDYQAQFLSYLKSKLELYSMDTLAQTGIQKETQEGEGENKEFQQLVRNSLTALLYLPKELTESSPKCEYISLERQSKSKQELLNRELDTSSKSQKSNATPLLKMVTDTSHLGKTKSLQALIPSTTLQLSKTNPTLPMGLSYITVSPSASQVKGEVKTMNVTFGLTSDAQYGLFNPEPSFSKTSKDTLRLDSTLYLATWQAMVTDVRGDYSARQKSARAIRETDCLSWGTPNTMDMLPSRSYEAMKRQATNGGRKNRQRPGNLREQIDPLMVQAYREARAESNQVVNWQTPEAQNHTGYQVSHGKKILRLGSQAKSCQSQDQMNHNTNGKNLAQWGTQNANDANNPNMKDNHDVDRGLLRGQVLQYPTPQARDYKGSSGRSMKGLETDLPTAVKNWPTVAAHEARLGFQDRSNGKKGKQESLTTIASKQEGETTLLNPKWVAQLMGLPKGWIEVDSRIDELRMLGNGVVPHQAEKAFRELSEIL